MSALPVLLLLSVLCFGLLQTAPGDPAESLLRRGNLAPPPRAEVARLRVTLGLDDPLPVQYGRWLRDALRGDFGRSYSSGRPVRAVLRDVVPPTLLLLGVGFALAWSAALLLGVLSGSAPGSWRARVISGATVALLALPTFVVALIGLYLIAATWRLLPTSGMTDAGERVSVAQVVRHLALPALVLGVSYFGWYARVVDAAVGEVHGMMYIQFARARGLPPGLLMRRHVLRPALLPFVAQVGASFGALIGGAYAVEVIFAWPGAGRELVRAAASRDYPVVMALVLLSGLAVVLGNLAADLVCAVLDPRLRQAGSPRG